MTAGRIRRFIDGAAEGLWPNDQASAVALHAANDEVNDVLAALATARARQADCFRDAHARGWHDAEVARLLGIGAATVNQKRARGGVPVSRHRSLS